MPRLPAIIYGIISITCGIISLYVPETLNRPLPNSIDDVVKWPRSLSKEEKKRVKKLNKEELLKIIPVSFPMTNHLKGFKSIAKYLVDEWERHKLPCFTTKSWCKLAMLIASKDLANLQQCFEIAKKISDRSPEQEQ